MSGPHDTRMTRQTSALGEALRALPAAQPPELWPQVARRARRGRQRWRSLGIPLAVAASVLLALLLWPGVPSIENRGGSSSLATSPPSAKNSAALTALRERSLRLEHWVRRLDNGGAPLDGPSLVQASRIEDGISMVDMQLASIHDSPPVQQTLWQRRVALLQQLAALRIGQSGLATVDTNNPPLIVN